MDNQLFIGIDPGASGSICLLDPLRKQTAFMDTTRPFREIVDWLLQAKDEGLMRFALLEEVHSIPKMSAKSNFTFGRNYQLMHCALMAANYPYDLVQPKKWQKAIGVPVKTRGGAAMKKAVLGIAERLYPEAELYGPKGGHLDGRSDALMIAHCCYLIHKL